MANTQTFPTVDPDKWERIKVALLANFHITVGADVGSGTDKGITLSWVYDPNTQILSITTLTASWYIGGEDQAAAKVAALVNSA